MIFTLLFVSLMIALICMLIVGAFEITVPHEETIGDFEITIPHETHTEVSNTETKMRRWIRGVSDMQDYLPDDLEKVTLKDLVVGEIAYTVHWAFFADANRKMWANGNYKFTHQPRGTSHVRVERAKDCLLVHRNTLEDASYRAGASTWDNGSKIPVRFV